MKAIASLFLLLFTFSTYSQVVNIENRRLGDGTHGFSGAMNLNFSVQKQKDILSTFNFKPMVQYKFNGKTKNNTVQKDTLSKDSSIIDSNKVKKPASYRHLILLINDLTYTGSKGTTYANFGMSHLRYSYHIKESAWEWESYTQIQYNKLLLQKARYILGTGLRVKIFDIKAKANDYEQRQIRMLAGSSILYEYEEIKYTDRPIGYENAMRWNTYLSTYLNFRHFELTSTTYIQPNISNFKDVKFSGEYSILFRVTEPFSIRFTFNHYLDSRPPETVQRGTFYMSVGFVYKLDKFSIEDTKLWAKKMKDKAKPIKKEPEIEVTPN
jgi:hypothetical protein